MLLASSYATDTLKKYKGGWNTLVNFMYDEKIKWSFPIPNNVIEALICHLHQEKSSYSKIQSTVTSIAFFHKVNDHPDPSKTFRITRIMRALKAKTTFKPKLLPLRFETLKNLIDICQSYSETTHLTLLPAVLLFTYHGCFRIGEVVKSNDLRHTLHMKDISFTESEGKEEVRITLPTYKHSSEPATLTIPASRDKYCPVRYLHNYLQVRGNQPGPIFLMPNGSPVNRAFIASRLKELLIISGKNPALYNTHSLRIGRASDLAARGTPDHLIRHTGRWSTEAYLGYIRFADFKTPPAV